MIGDSYSYLIKKLDEFIRKYYFNKLLKGILFSIAIILIYFLVIILAENQFYFSTLFRKVLFFSFLALSLTIVGYYIINPLFKLNHFGKIISHKQAAEIIGRYFKNVEDKLLNILQLKDASLSLQDASLIQASIDQKSSTLKPIPFTNAVDLNENKKYLKYAVPPLLVLLFLFLWQPSIVKNSTDRLIRNNTTFVKPAPFTFKIKNESLTALQFEDYKLDVEVSGSELPVNVYVVKDGIKNSMQKLNTNNFSYIFSNVQNNIKFYFEGSGFTSDEYEIKVQEKPIIKNFQLKVDYPNYLGLKDKTYINEGDISVPEGSKIQWIFDAQATDKISVQFSDTSFSLNNSGNNTFIFDKTLYNSDKYIVKIINNSVSKIDSSAFNISVVKDNYPEIEVEAFQDSTNNDVYFYIGKIIDDYGLTKLILNYTISNNEGNKIRKIINIPFSRGTASDFSYYWNLKEIGVEPGDKLDYYFQVFDNDAVNGSKSTKSKWLSIKLESKEEMSENSEQQFDKIKDDLKKSMQESAELQEELKKIQEELLQKNELSWESKKSIEDLIKKQENLQKKLDDIKSDYKDNVNKQEDFKNVNPEIKKKQEQIQKLFDNVLDEETKALMDKLQKLMEEMNKEDALEKMKDMQVNDEDIEDELDRMLELLKKLEQEQKVQETIEKLNELSKKQEELSKKTADGREDKEQLKKEQEEINKEFEKLQEELSELNKESEQFDLDEQEKQGEEISEELEKSKEELNKGNNKKSSESQKGASEKMKEMADAMQQMMNAMQQASTEEDMESLRQLLENLVILSLEEERLLDEFKITTINTPKYVQLVQDQFKLIDDSKLVEDSLYALAKRVFEIEAFITDEIKDINRNLDKAVKQLEDRNVNNATVSQQYVMTGYNNLALMLSEVLSQMQQQMAQQMEGNQMCENPGNKPGSKPGKIPSLKKMQQQLSDQINEMGEMMKEGSSPGSKEGKGQSEKLAKMAAKQQAIRQKLEELNQEENKDGKGSLGNLQKIIDDMKENEEDIVNKQITSELIKRQQEIMTRLLQAENAERERDEKEERKSITAQDYEKTTPPSLEEYIKKKQGSIELYRSIPPKFKSFYRKISENYFKNVSEIN